MPLKELPKNHDLKHLEWALGFIEKTEVAIDGGAHQGIWTRRLLDVFDHVIAFEPIESNRKKIPAAAEIYPYAIGDYDGPVGMQHGTENTGQGHVTEGDSTKMVMLDSLGVDCDFLKLDVEGYELQALIGAWEMIHRCKPLIMIEENGLCKRYGVEPMAADQWLKDAGYKCLGNMNKDYLYQWNR